MQRPQHLDVLAERAAEAVAVEVGRPQLDDQRAKLVERLARELAEALDLLSRGVGVAVEQRRGGLGGEDDAE